MSEHTKGPWSVDGMSVVMDNQVCILNPAPDHEKDFDVIRANAALISAAPDYHEVAPDMLGVLTNSTVRQVFIAGGEIAWLDKLTTKLRAAIAKAGVTP